MRGSGCYQAHKPSQVRQLLREGSVSGATSGMCVGYVQANMAVLPAEVADDFEAICRRNVSALPLIERLAVGSFSPRLSAQGADIRTDLGGFMTFDGETWSESTDLLGAWRDDWVTFIIGCSFSAERALQNAGVDLRHLELGAGVPIYRTNLALESPGGLSGSLVVSMRAIRDNQVETAIRVTEQYPLAHGAPVWVGPGERIGCRDGGEPDWGSELRPTNGETPVYWACGVTPQTIIEESGISGAAVHSPGNMFITDILDEDIWRVSVEEWRLSNEF